MTSSHHASPHVGADFVSTENLTNSLTVQTSWVEEGATTLTGNWMGDPNAPVETIGEFMRQRTVSQIRRILKNGLGFQPSELSKFDGKFLNNSDTSLWSFQYFGGSTTNTWVDPKKSPQEQGIHKLIVVITVKQVHGSFLKHGILLSSLVQTLVQTIKKDSAMLDNQKREIAEIIARLNQSDEKIAGLTEEITRLTKESAHTKTRNNHLTKENARLNKKINRQAEQIERQAGQIERLQVELSELRLSVDGIQLRALVDDARRKILTENGHPALLKWSTWCQQLLRNGQDMTFIVRSTLKAIETSDLTFSDIDKAVDNICSGRLREPGNSHAHDAHEPRIMHAIAAFPQAEDQVVLSDTYTYVFRKKFDFNAIV